MKRKPLSKAHKEFLLNSQAHVTTCEQKVFALQWALHPTERYNTPPPEVAQASQVIYGWLHQQMARAYRDMFMLGLFFDEEDQAALRQIVMDRFVKERADLSMYFDDHGWAPDLIADELQFLDKRQAIIGDEDGGDTD